jgi:RES domain-containing protein
VELWRISNHRNLNGSGGMRYAARWHTAGQRIVYLAASPAGALIEVLVHLELDADDLPPDYTLLRVEVPAEVAIQSLHCPRGEGWKTDERITRKLGDAWLAAQSSALACVPSAILPSTLNYLLNPAHPEAKRIRIKEATKQSFDVRLLRSIRS